MEFRDPDYVKKLIESRKKPNVFIRISNWIKSKISKDEVDVEPRVTWVEPEVIESLPYDPNKPTYLNE